MLMIALHQIPVEVYADKEAFLAAHFMRLPAAERSAKA
jgi:hypothetical protein